jgi:hypothetical protein
MVIFSALVDLIYQKNGIQTNFGAFIVACSTSEEEEQKLEFTAI